jgi:hypothetical protein
VETCVDVTGIPPTPPMMNSYRYWSDEAIRLMFGLEEDEPRETEWCGISGYPEPMNIHKDDNTTLAGHLDSNI